MYLDRYGHSAQLICNDKNTPSLSLPVDLVVVAVAAPAPSSICMHVVVIQAMRSSKCYLWERR